VTKKSSEKPAAVPAEMTRKTFDSGLSENIYPKPDYEEDFIALRGREAWTTYREQWVKCARLELELDHPLHLEFELNYSCNLRCPMCTWAVETAVQRKADWFKFDDYKRIIDQAVAAGTKSARLCYVNEPLIRKDIDQFIAYAVKAGLLDVMITTNATLLTRDMSRRLIEAGLTKLNVSLDATTAETYDKIRVGGNFKKTLENIDGFLAVRDEMKLKLPKLRVSFCLTKINAHELDEFMKTWTGKADSLGIQQAQNPFKEGHFKFEGRGEAIMDQNAVSPESFHCPEPFKRLNLRSDGTVLPCCSFQAVDLVVGDWKKQSLQEIWNSDKMNALRDVHRAGDYRKIPACKACIESLSL
jgi:radical SAM protein with 4Fe4S-binding SPASM domain